MKKKASIVVSIALACITSVSTAAEADKRTPLDAFRGDSWFHLKKCSLSVQLASLGGGSSPDQADYGACIKTGLADIKPAFQRALSSTKSATKKEALKSYYAAWVSALQGVAPKSEERVISYERRRAAADDRLNELWARVEIE